MDDQFRKLFQHKFRKKTLFDCRTSQELRDDIMHTMATSKLQEDIRVKKILSKIASNNV